MRLWIAFWLAVSALPAQFTRDVIGVHDLSAGSGSPVAGSLPGSCMYCHAPHNGIGGMTPLWNQKLSTQVYAPYVSSTLKGSGSTQPSPGSASLLCLSCHDGTVAPGQTQAYGTIGVTGAMKAGDVFGSNLQSSHPNSMILPLKDAPHLFATLTSSGQTADPTHAVKLIKGNIECTSCHNPHVQATDRVSQNFLVRDGADGKICLACHDPNREVTGQANRLAQWTTGAHATASNTAQGGSTSPVGNYHTVGQNACMSCHRVHNAPGAVDVLRGANEQDCMLCHGGGSNISPAVPNIFAEFAKIGHPFPNSSNLHTPGESAVLNHSRHSTCADCHNPHSSARVTAFSNPPNVRPSQNNVVGINASDGVSVVTPAAANQFENCLRCHGTSIGKESNPIFGYLPARVVSAGDPLNVIPQFAMSSASSHPVTHDRSSGLPQPSLRPYMLNLDGATQGRAMGSRILCTDCHNSDDNREFGGTGPNGPHGSKYLHILERRYEFSQAPRPGQTVLNLFPNPDPGPTGPYALCGKCHDLQQVLANTSFREHARHINDGFSCSTCHAAHGTGSYSATVSGERMVNFDGHVVAGEDVPIAYNRASNTCTLTCHGVEHGSDDLRSKTKGGAKHK